jgi:hypothetical protein
LQKIKEMESDNHLMQWGKSSLYRSDLMTLILKKEISQNVVDLYGVSQLKMSLIS